MAMTPGPAWRILNAACYAAAETLAAQDMIPASDAVCYAASENFWNVWQSAGAWPRLTAKVQVTSLT